MPTDVTPYWQRLRALREARGLSQPKLYRLVDDLSLDTIRALERDPDRPGRGERTRARYPSAQTLEKLAAALGVSPDVFGEYRLAKARESLDERVVGLAQALASYERAITALRRRGTRTATASGQRAQDQRTPRPTPAEAPNAQEGG